MALRRLCDGFTQWLFEGCFAMAFSQWLLMALFDGFAMVSVAFRGGFSSFSQWLLWCVAMAPVGASRWLCERLAMALRASCGGCRDGVALRAALRAAFAMAVRAAFGGYDGLKDAMALWLRSDGSLLRFWLLFALAPVAIVPVRWLL